ncbi:MAG: hypothetical protein IDH49_07240 [Gammaproteobacteria bacterium]|nr:hypothetical protein [Gammaproteobacteria bacterium]
MSIFLGFLLWLLFCSPSLLRAADGLSAQEEPSIARWVDQAASDAVSYHMLMGEMSYKPRVREEIARLSPEEFKQRNAIWPLAFLASHGNGAAMNVLLDLANGEGNDRAIAMLRRIGEDKVAVLREMYLTQHSEKNLRIRLRDSSFQNDPHVLYVAYLAKENFAALAEMIFMELETQARSQGKDLNTFLHELDPRGLFYKDFILQSAHFSMLHRVVNSPPSLRAIMDLLFKELSAEEINTLALRLALFVEDVIHATDFPYQREFQEYLLRLHDQATGKNKRLLAALIVVYKNPLSQLNDAAQAAKITSIAQKSGIKVEESLSLEEILGRTPLMVHVVFADKDAWKDYYQTTLGFFRSHGYRIFAKNEDGVHLEKGRIILVLIQADPEDQKGYDINAHLDAVDIVVSRSHSGNSARVFKKQPQPVGKKMIFLISACRSATTIPVDNESYPGAYIIGANSTATGDATNWITYYLLEGLMNGIADLKALETYVKANIAEAAPDLRGEVGSYVFPADNSQVVQRIVLRH